MNQIICNLLDFYQNRISSYDNHATWEKPLDILKNNFYCLSNKKSNRIEDHIDIDLIKGSAFSRSKSKLSLPRVFLSGLQKLLFYPLYFHWWQYHTNFILAIALLIIYSFQVANLFIYFSDSSSLVQNGRPVVDLEEILSPTVIMFILCLMYSVITSALPVCNETANNEGSSSQANPLMDRKKDNQSLTFQKPCDKKLGDCKRDSEITRNKEDDNFYKQVYLRESIYFSDELADDYDLNEGDLSDSDHTDNLTNFLNDSSEEPSSPASPRKPNLGETESESVLKRIPRNSSSRNVRASSQGFDAHREKISCTIWLTNEWKGVDLSMSEISTYIQTAVRKNKFPLDYFYIGIVFSILIGLLPVLYQQLIPGCKIKDQPIQQIKNQSHFLDGHSLSFIVETMPMLEVVRLSLEQIHLKLIASLFKLVNTDLKLLFVLGNTFFSTIILSFLLFSLLTVADRTLNQRFLHAKYFCYLTILRRAKKHSLPHFRLGKVENIKMWLSLRSFMKRNGPQRSIDVIISSTFLIGVGLCSIVCIRFLQDADFLSDCLLNWQLVLWCFCIWTYMLRFMAVGFKTNKKYRNCMSMVITEQINLYLQMEKKPERKEELMVVNNVLKLASDLLKEIENPFKISGLGVNPWVYNITKVVILSAFSAVVSELLGFKLKLYKIKIN